MIKNAKKLKRAIREGKELSADVKKCKMPFWKCEFDSSGALYDSKEMRHKLMECHMKGSISMSLLKLFLIVLLCMTVISMCCICIRTKCLIRKMK